MWRGCDEIFFAEDCWVSHCNDEGIGCCIGMWLTQVSSNIVTVNMMEAVGEAQVFAEKTGLGTGPMEELIGEAFGAVAGGYSKRYVFSKWGASKAQE